MLMLLNAAAIRAYREHSKSSYSILHCVSEVAAKMGLDEELVRQQFEKLYPGLLHPLITKSGKANVKKTN